MSTLEIICLIVLFIFGTIIGSFTCCQAWRIRYKEQKKKDLGKWSVCLSCGKRLTPSENIPVISWLLQRGKCKKCGAKIGKAEILSEIGLGLAFAAIGTLFLPKLLAAQETNQIIILSALALIVLITTSILWVLLIYDAKWGLLPTKLLAAANIFAVIHLGIKITEVLSSQTSWPEFQNFALNALGGVALLAGVYYLLYRLSGEKLVGSGDWLVALAISLMLNSWWLSLIVLFLSNFMGSIIGIYGKVKKGKQAIPFGPFLIIAFIIVYTLQNYLIINL